MNGPYRIYGVALRSDVPLPELEPCRVAAPVFTFEVSRAAPPVAGDPIVYADTVAGDRSLSCARCDGGYVVAFADAGTFFVRADGTLIVGFEPLAPTPRLRRLLLDYLLPRALNAAGRDALHATAVLTPRGVVAFVGESGSGKSTLAARFVAEAFPLVCDDCLVLDVERDMVMATPGYDGLRLLPDGIASTRAFVHAAPDDGTIKRRVTSPHTRADRGGPLAAVYILAAAPSASPTTSHRLLKRDGFKEILTACHRLDTADRAMLERQFHLLGSIAERVPISRLCVPRSLDALSDAVALVRREVGF